MHDVLRQRLLRKIESLPDEQVYQVLDYIEFLESKYVTARGVTTSGLQKFAEGLEDKLRRRAVSPNTIREAFQLISAADRVLSGVSTAGRQIIDDLGSALDAPEEGDDRPASADGTARTFEADPRKRRAGSSTSASSTAPAEGGRDGGDHPHRVERPHGDDHHPGNEHHGGDEHRGGDEHHGGNEHHGGDADADGGGGISRSSGHVKGDESGG